MKKVVSLLLVLVLALGMSTMAFAAVSITGTQPGVTIDLNSQSDSVNGAAFPGQTKTYSLRADASNSQTPYFTVPTVTPSGKTAPAATDGLTKSELSAAKVTLKTRISKGSAAIDVVELVYAASAVNTNQKIADLKITLIKPFASTNTDGLDFECTAYFMVDSTSYLSNGIVFTGTLKNDFSENIVDKDTDYFDMSLGTIMKPSELVKSMEYYLGENVSLFGRALKGTKYFGVANTKSVDNDDANILKYDLDGVYHIKAINLQSVASYVTLGDADATHYIYDGNMKYLGRGNDHLPYSDTYYLSAKELDTDASTDEEEPTDEESTDEEPVAPNPGTGADDNYPTNVNDNPGTGR